MKFISKPKSGNHHARAIIASAISLAAIASGDARADLNSTLVSSQTFMINIGKTLNIVAGLVGAYMIFSGIMAWKKSSGDHGGQVEFKSIAIPVVAGACLVAFSFFVGVTSQTFGFTNANSF